MIELANITKKIRQGHLKVTYTGLNIVVPDGVNMAFLGKKQSAVEALADLICAADAPDRGKITRTESISWALPSASFVAKHLTLAANARFLARLYEADEDVLVSRIVELGQLQEWINVKVEECPKEARSTFCLLAGLCLPFDRYIFTSLGAAGKAQGGRVSELLTDLMARASILLIGQDIKTAQEFCSQAYVFDEGKATFYDDMEAAAEHFNAIEAQEVDEGDFMGGDSELEDLVNVDF